MQFDEFKQFIDVPSSVLETEQKMEDDEQAENVQSGTQYLTIEPFGRIKFEWPDMELMLKGDRVYAEFKTRELKAGKLATEEQLKAMFQKPVPMNVDGVEFMLGSGAWPAENEDKMEEMSKRTREYRSTIEVYRNDLYEIGNKILSSASEEEKKELEDKRARKYSDCYDVFCEMVQEQLQLAEMQSKRFNLFSISLEEHANMERVKLYAPQCIKVKKEDGTYDYLWHSSEEFMRAGLSGLKVISLFNLFLRGVDVRFFGGMLGGSMS